MAQLLAPTYLFNYSEMDSSVDYVTFYILAQSASSKTPFLATVVHLSLAGLSSLSLANFTSFPNLKSVSLEAQHLRLEPSFKSSLLRIDSLSLRSTHLESITDLRNLCLNLTRISMESLPIYYPSMLEHLPPSLQHLVLRNIRKGDAAPLQLDLSRFNLLRHLSFGDSIFPPIMSSTLIDLEHLESLHLGLGKISTIDTIRLFSGPHRLASLRTLRLDPVQAKIGSRLDIDEEDVDKDGERLERSREYCLETGVEVDWLIPEFDLPGGLFTVEGVRDMVQAAKTEGVMIEGGIIHALEVMDAYYLEFADLLMYRIYQDRNLDYYSASRRDYPQARLPDRNFDSLDPNNLKLVKTDVPEEEWFCLTLENGRGFEMR